MNNQEKRVALSSIGLGYLLPKDGARISLLQAHDAFAKVTNILNTLQLLTEGSNVEVELEIKKAGIHHERLASRFGHDSSEIQGAWIMKTPPNVAIVQVSVYDYDFFSSLFSYKLPEPQRSEAKIRSEERSRVALAAVSAVALEAMKIVGLPDVFTDSYINYSKKVLMGIYDEIVALGKEVDGSTLIVHDRGQCPYGLEKCR